MHNHSLQVDNSLFVPQFRSLSDEIKQNIEHYVKYGVSDLLTIRALLKLKFSGEYLHSKDLTNYIQIIKMQIGGNDGNDVTSLLNKLFEEQREGAMNSVIP